MQAAFCVSAHLCTDFAVDDFFDNQPVRVERLLQAGREQARGAADLGGNVGSAQGGGGQPARAVGGVQIGIGQVRARRLNRVIFVVGEFGIHLFHGGGIAQCADGGQVVVGIAPQGGVSAFGRVQAAFVAPLCRQAAVQRFVELRQGLAVVPLVFRLPCGVGIVRNKSRAETMAALPCGRNVAGGG